MTATQADSERTISRRGVMRATAFGIGATAVGGIGSKYAGSPIGGAQAIAPALIAGAAIGAAAYGHIIVDDNSEEVDDALSWQSHVDAFTTARETQLRLDQTLASLERDVQLVGNKAREEAIFAIYEQAVDSGTETDASDAAEAAIDEAYATVEKSLFQSFNIHMNWVRNVLHMFFGTSSSSSGYFGTEVTHENPSGTTSPNYFGDPFRNGGDDGFDGYADPNLRERTETLLDGSTETFVHYAYTESGQHVPDDEHGMFTPSKRHYDSLFEGTSITYPDSAASSRWTVHKPDESNYDTVDEPLDVSYNKATLVDGPQWRDIHVKLLDEHSALISEVSSMVDTYFQPAQDGEYDITQMLGPKHLTDTASTASDYQEATMAMRALGFPISEQVVTVELTGDDGDPVELYGRLGWSANDGTGLIVGEQLNTENIPGSIYGAFNIPDGYDSISGATNTTNTTDTDDGETAPGAEIVEISGAFTIVSAGGAEAVTFEERTLASTDTTSEEVEQIFTENYEANKEATENVHDTSTDGGGGGAGGGFFSGDGPSLGIVAAIVGGLGVFYALTQEDA